MDAAKEALGCTAQLEHDARLPYRCALPADAERVPSAAGLGDHSGSLTAEAFRSILHVVRWPADRLDAVLYEIAVTGRSLMFPTAQ
jgi:delta 1-pyrroline-5-carboxylate dehydrogenase